MLTPIRSKYTNVILGKPSGWNETLYGDCIDLPVYDTKIGLYYSWWKLNWKERLAILFGAPIRLIVFSGNQFPPVSVDVEIDDVHPTKVKESNNEQ